MRRTPLSIPEIAIIGGTRAALGAGVALLLGDRLNHDERRAVGWTLDGKQVLFASGRNSYAGFSRLFTIPAEGGFETQLLLDRAVEGSYSPDGARLAYVPIDQWQRAWKRYRGGQTKPIWIARLSDSVIQKVPRENSNDFNPMWIGSRVYFLSDRNGPVTLFAYDTQTKQVLRIEQAADDLPRDYPVTQAESSTDYDMVKLRGLDSSRRGGNPHRPLQNCALFHRLH